MAVDAQVTATINDISSAESWNRRVALIRQIPERFGLARHTEVYAAVAEAVYVAELAPDFAYLHWRPEYELPAIERAYTKAVALTRTFQETDASSLERAIAAEPETLRVFRLFLGFTTQEFAVSTIDPAAELGVKPLSNGRVKAIEAGRRGRGDAMPVAAAVAAVVIHKAMRSELFPHPSGDLRNKISKPDTVDGWNTIRKYATENVPFPVFLHQRHYGGAFRQLLDATSGRRGGILEDAVRELFTNRKVPLIRTGQRTKAMIAEKFGITVTPAPDFVIHDEIGALRAFLECKQGKRWRHGQRQGGEVCDLEARRNAPGRRTGICRSRWPRMAANRRHSRASRARHGWARIHGQNLGCDDDR
jgi:hypothetical protein